MILARVAFWALLPLTAVQGLWLRSVAMRLPGAAGARQGAVGTGARLRLLAVGDSIIDGVGVDHTFESLPVQFASSLAERGGYRVHWRIEGHSGFGIEQVIERLRSLDPDPHPDLVLLSVGVNDVTGLSGTRRWRRQLQTLRGELERRWPDARVLFAGLPQMAHFPGPPQPLRFSLGLRAATLDRVAAGVLSAWPNAIHVPTRIDPQRHPFCADGFHPAAESCKLWAAELASLAIRRK